MASGTRGAPETRLAQGRRWRNVLAGSDWLGHSIGMNEWLGDIMRTIGLNGLAGLGGLGDFQHLYILLHRNHFCIALSTTRDLSVSLIIRIMHGLEK